MSNILPPKSNVSITADKYLELLQDNFIHGMPILLCPTKEKSQMLVGFLVQCEWGNRDAPKTWKSYLNVLQDGIQNNVYNM